MSAAAAAAAASAATYTASRGRSNGSVFSLHVEEKKTSSILSVGLIAGSVISILAMVAGFIKFSK